MALFFALAAVGSPIGAAQGLMAPSHDHYLKAPKVGLFDRFGGAIALDQGVMVVGVVGAGVGGLAHVYTQTPSGGWQYSSQLEPECPDLADGFGHAVAISGDTIVVGAIWEDAGSVGVNGNQKDNSAVNAGAAFVFVRSGADWVQQAYLKASNADSLDEFGFSVAIDGDLILVGAPNEDSSGVGRSANPLDNGASNAGSVYVFVRNGTAWSQQSYLKPLNTDADDAFGWSVSIDDGFALIGAPCEDGGIPGVGSNGVDNSASCAGAGYVFEDRGSSWVQTSYLKPLHVDPSDFFGTSVAISGGALVVGAPGERSSATNVDGDPSNNDLASAGAAYVFQRSGSSWSQSAYLKASNTGAWDAFGAHLSFGSSTIVVGAPGEASSSPGLNGDGSLDDAMEAGAAYVFRRFGASWVPVAYIKASNPDWGDRFGTATAVDGLYVVVGAPQEDGADTGWDGDQLDNSSVDAGSTYILSGFSGPLRYCTKFVPLLPCTVLLVVSDPKAGPVSGAGGYVVGADSVQGLQDGLLFVGMTGPSNIPFFGGGVLCMQPPLRRGPVMRSGGLSTNTCSGSYSTVVNDGGGLDPGPGNSAWYQHWFRAIGPNGQAGFGLSQAVQLDFR